MIQLDHLSFAYRHGAEAICDVSATIEPGIHLLLGENGAGKTTLLRLMAGLLIPSEGRISISGHNPSSRQPSALKTVFMLPDTLTIQERTIRLFAAAHSRFYPTFSQETFEQNLAEFALTGNEKYSELSLGLRHKSLLAYVLALGVDVLLLDEPANGLDITSKKTLRSMLARSVGLEQTAIISTHTVTDLRELFDGAIVLQRGRLLLCLPSWEIASRISCTSSAIPAYGAIYTEQSSGLFHSIMVNDTSEPADLDYALLYSALLSPHRDKLLEILTQAPLKSDAPENT